MSTVNKSYKEQLERVKKALELSDPSEKLSDRVSKYMEEVQASPVSYFGPEKAVIMLVGCPLSGGKTTFAQHLHSTLKKAVMQSRDFI